MLLALFLIIGTVAHDPWWKRGEAWGFGIIYHFYLTHTWLIPMNGGVPFMEKPPLYYWTAELFCRLFAGILPLHDAARLASVLYTIIAALFTFKSADVFFADRAEHITMRNVAALLFLGTYGLVRLSHALVTDIALLAGTAVALYGMALLWKKPESPKQAGLWFGIGIGMTFMAKGLFIPAALAISAISVWQLLPRPHNARPSKAVLAAIAISLPLITIWPALLYHDSPILFMNWFWNNNIGRFIGFSVPQLGAENDRLHMLAMLPVFMFPTVFLAAAELICARRQWRRPEYVIPLVISCVILLILFISASGRTPYFLPLVPGFALLGAQAMMRLRPAMLRGWNVAARISFSVFAGAVWLVWWNLLYPPDHRPIPWLEKRFNDIFPPDFVIHGHQNLACALALVSAVLWMLSFRLKADTVANTARIWFTGAALAWCTTHTLLMPWINETHSFRKVVLQMQEFVARTPYKDQCIGNYNLGENMAPMLEYFTQRTEPFPNISLDSSPCPLFLTFTLRSAPEDIDPRWHMIWRGTRILDIKSNELRLYERKP